MVRWNYDRKQSGDQCDSEVLMDYFKGKSLCEISALLVEDFKHERINPCSRVQKFKLDNDVIATFARGRTFAVERNGKQPRSLATAGYRCVSSRLTET